MLSVDKPGMNVRQGGRDIVASRISNLSIYSDNDFIKSYKFQYLNQQQLQSVTSKCKDN